VGYKNMWVQKTGGVPKIIKMDTKIVLKGYSNDIKNEG
jgi:hypothetical protein